MHESNLSCEVYQACPIRITHNTALLGTQCSVIRASCRLSRRLALAISFVAVVLPGRDWATGVRALSAVEARPWGHATAEAGPEPVGPLGQVRGTSPPTLHTAVACCNLIAWKQARRRYHERSVSVWHCVSKLEQGDVRNESSTSKESVLLSQKASLSATRVHSVVGTASIAVPCPKQRLTLATPIFKYQQQYLLARPLHTAPGCRHVQLSARSEVHSDQ
jgi:hypothetical protein